MKLNSDFILEILNFFIWIYTIVVSLVLSFLIVLFLMTLFGIDIGNMKDMKINVDFGNEKITNIQTLEKGKLLLILAYSIVMGTLQLLVMTYIIKILKKIKLNQYFSAEIYFLISKIARLAFVLGCISLLVSFVTEFFSGKFSVSIDISNKNFQFFLFAATVYIIAEVYKKAVDLKSENDLTI